jgi:hypothetical protein
MKDLFTIPHWESSASILSAAPVEYFESGGTGFERHNWPRDLNEFAATMQMMTPGVRA